MSEICGHKWTIQNNNEFMQDRVCRKKKGHDGLHEDPSVCENDQPCHDKLVQVNHTWSCMLNRWHRGLHKHVSEGLYFEWGSAAQASEKRVWGCPNCPLPSGHAGPHLGAEGLKRGPIGARFDGFADEEIGAIYAMMSERHGSYAWLTQVFAEILLEMWRRGLVIRKDNKT